VLIRQLQYLVALAHEGHFARAAERCGVSQPTLSAALRQLEDELGTAIVERGNRFRGFTAQGGIVLEWARRMLADERSLRQELDASRGMLSGRLRLGAIPSVNAVVPDLTTSFLEAHPLVGIDEIEATSHEVLRDLATFDLDAAVTYVDDEPLDHVRTLPIAVERYVAIVPAGIAVPDGTTMRWADAARLPLCLLRPDMQNRRIFDAAFAAAGVAPNVKVEVYSMMAKLCYVQSGRFATLMPATMASWVDALEGVRVLPLVEPDVVKTVGLVIAERDPVPALIEAFWQHVRARVAAAAAAG
jgi:DNA-binding transcriptional LysR family regulator